MKGSQVEIAERPQLKLRVWHGRREIDVLKEKHGRTMYDAVDELIDIYCGRFRKLSPAEQIATREARKDDASRMERATWLDEAVGSHFETIPAGLR